MLAVHSVEAAIPVESVWTPTELLDLISGLGERVGVQTHFRVLALFVTCFRTLGSRRSGDALTGAVVVTVTVFLALTPVLALCPPTYLPVTDAPALSVTLPRILARAFFNAVFPIELTVTLTFAAPTGDLSPVFTGHFTFILTPWTVFVLKNKTVNYVLHL